MSDSEVHVKRPGKILPQLASQMILKSLYEVLTINVIENGMVVFSVISRESRML